MEDMLFLGFLSTLEDVQRGHGPGLTSLSEKQQLDPFELCLIFSKLNQKMHFQFVSTKADRSQHAIMDQCWKQDVGDRALSCLCNYQEIYISVTQEGAVITLLSGQHLCRICGIKYELQRVAFVFTYWSNIIILECVLPDNAKYCNTALNVSLNFLTTLSHIEPN